MLSKEINSFIKLANECMLINEKANNLIIKEDYSQFTKSELCTIARLSADEATVLRRRAKETIKKAEEDLQLSQIMVDISLLGDE